MTTEATYSPPTYASGNTLPPRPTPVLSDDRNWGVEDVAYFLQLSGSMVKKLERLGELPALPRMGRCVRWHPTVVRAYRVGKRGAELKKIAAGVK